MPHNPNPAAESAAVLDAAALAPIVPLPTAVTAFIGRTLKGPLNAPTTIDSYAEYQRLFGGLWQPAPLSYAVEQFFENGGQQAIVVRVANGAHPPTLRLPAGAGALLLRGLAPGTREYLRASVDYDGIPGDAADEFNLVLQRLRASASELIEEQEILRRISVRPDAERAADLVLSRSQLMRVAGPLPAQRPERTGPARPGGIVGYVAANNDGTDGADLTDYDLIGDAADGTGLFALRAGPRFQLLCVPPPGRERDVGLAAWLVAARLCRDRQAMLIVDPPRAWNAPEAAWTGAAHWPLHSGNALLYLPRLVAHDRLRGRSGLFAPCGAIAGFLARADAAGTREAAAALAPVLRPPLRPQFALTEVQRQQFAQHGINGFGEARLHPGAAAGARTLLAENAARGEASDLWARRLTLWLQACILEGTSWTRMGSGGEPQWQRVRAQVESFLAGVAASRALGGGAEGERYFVICDERLNSAAAVAQGCCRLLFGFAAYRAGEFQSCLVTHERSGSSVRAVTGNRLAIAGARVAAEIETALLRQLVGAA